MKAYAEHISSGTADELSGLTLVGMQTLVGDADNGGFVNFDLELDGGAKSFVFSPSDAEGNYVAGSNVSVNSLSFVTEEGEAGGPGPVVADCEPGETAISFGLGETVVDGATVDAKGLSGQGGLDELNGLYGAQACIEFGVSNADSFGVGGCCDTARWLNVGSASGSDAQVWINLLDGDLVFKRVGGPSFNVNIKDG